MSVPSQITTVEQQRREMIRVAYGILDGSIGIVAGARQITRLSFFSSAERDKDVVVFSGIDSESGHLPLGEVRRHWNTEALKIKDVELQSYETRVAERAFQACKSLIARYEAVSND